MYKSDLKAIHPGRMTLQKLTEKRLWISILLGAITPAVALWVWLSALSFIPVPWPDDSAFYFVAKDLFHWPPRWVMLTQAPFEPTYRLWNFNTMPLYPILIGLGRLIGIDGSFALKLWPLGFWAASGSVLAVGLYRARLPALLTAIITLAYAMDPELHWASVLVRPESLIGLCGMILVLGLTLGWFNKKEYPWYFDPISVLLAIAAYAHFNAIHLVFPVALAFVFLWNFNWKRVLEIALKTTMYLGPWIGTVLGRPGLFIHQMHTQWERLAVKNSWLNSFDSAINGMFQALGAPEPWPTEIYWTSYLLWALIAVALIWGLAVPTVRLIRKQPQPEISLVPAAAWIISAFWLWNSKPEVWFIFYLHQAAWCFAGIAALKLWKARETVYRVAVPALVTLLAPTLAAAAIYSWINVDQATRLDHTQSWHWERYHQLVDCIDNRLKAEEATLGNPKPFRVWAPTFPDTTIELSRRHPDWQFTRTNDFHARNYLAIRHGQEVEAVVITEMINWQERSIDAPWSERPDVHSIWLDWKGYYIHDLDAQPGWKPVRYLCQKGRWQAFILFNKKPIQQSQSNAISKPAIVPISSEKRAD